MNLVLLMKTISHFQTIQFIVDKWNNWMNQINILLIDQKIAYKTNTVAYKTEWVQGNQEVSMNIFHKTVKPMVQLQSWDMDMVSKVGLMGHITKAIGYIIKLMGKAYFGMPKEICIEESLKMIWPMAMVNTRISMAHNIKESL